MARENVLIYIRDTISVLCTMIDKKYIEMDIL